MRRHGWHRESMNVASALEIKMRRRYRNRSKVWIRKLFRPVPGNSVGVSFSWRRGRRKEKRGSEKAPLAAQESGEYAIQGSRQLHDIMSDKWQVSCMTVEWKMEWNMPDPSQKQLNI